MCGIPNTKVLLLVLWHKRQQNKTSVMSKKPKIVVVNVFLVSNHVRRITIGVDEKNENWKFDQWVMYKNGNLNIHR